MASSSFPIKRPAPPAEGYRLPFGPRRRGRPVVRLLLAGIALLAAARIYADGTAADLSEDALKQMSVEDLMNVEVTSVSKEPEKLLDAPAAIEVVTNDDITNSGASSIPEALELAGNLDVAQKNSHDWAISARGFDTSLSNKLLVLMDGRSVYSPLFSGVFWDVQNYLMADIDRIEVISGPGGTLWGANAVNGVINITTKSAQETQGLYAETGGGSELEDFAAARYGGTLAPGVYYRVYGTYFDRGDEVLSNGSDANDAWKMSQGGFRLDADNVPQTTLTLSGDFYSGNEDEETGGSAAVSGDNILGRWTRSLADDATMSLQAYYDHTYLADPIPAAALGALPLAPAGILTDRLDTYDVEFQHNLNFGQFNHAVWGLGYRFTHDFTLNAPSLAFLPPSFDQNLYSVFAQDELTLRRDLYLTVGSKLEHNDYTGYELEPNVRLKWDVAPKQMLWGAISRAVRTPSRVDEDEIEAAPPHLALIEGSPDFTSETVVAYELGYRGELNDQISLSISAFYNEYNDIRSTSITPRTLLPFYFANNLDGETHGLELSGTYQALPWWQLRASYDLLKENIGVKPGQFDLNDALNETADPESQFAIGSDMALLRNLALNARLRWVDSLTINNGTTIGTVPSYFELNARLAWRVSKNFELSLVGQNLLHAEHPEYGFPSPTQEEIQRSFYGKAVWRY